MGVLLFAEQISTAFDWWAGVYVPIGCSFLGGLIAMLAGLFVVSRTEWYRRMAAWEPYAERLWVTRYEAGRELIDRSEELMHCAEKIWSNRGNNSEQWYHIAREKLTNNMVEFENGLGVRMMIFGNSVNEAVNTLTNAVERVAQITADDNVTDDDSDVFHSLTGPFVSLVKALKGDLHIAKVTKAEKQSMQQIAKRNR